MIQHIPSDICFEIASFLPENDLRNMLLVNSTYFHLAMEARYQHISFVFEKERLSREGARNLSRLKSVKLTIILYLVFLTFLQSETHLLPLWLVDSAFTGHHRRSP